MLKLPLLQVLILLSLAVPVSAATLASSNIPLDSPIYLYLEKLSGMGLVTSDVRGLKPFSRAEAARLTLEAEKRLIEQPSTQPFAKDLIQQIRDLLPREMSLQGNNDKPKLFDLNPVASSRLRYVYLDGIPRSYERQARDYGNDGVLGIGSGLRPRATVDVQHHGTEGTPLLENNEGTIYRRGTNLELRTAAEGYFSRYAVALVEPQLLYSRERNDATLTLNRGYVKIGGGALELEAGRDSNWLGLGYRGAITLSNNPRNLDQIKISSPEPFQVGWLSWLGDLKYALLVSRLDRTVVNGQERQPWYSALKLICKPTSNLEIGFNMGKQVGGPGVNNSLGDMLRGLIGGTSADNANNLAGIFRGHNTDY